MGGLHLPGPRVGAGQGRPSTKSRSQGCEEVLRQGVVPRDQAQDVRNAPGHRDGNQKWRSHGHMSTHICPSCPCPGPCIYSLNNNEAIYLFHLERDLVPVTSLECSLAFLPPAPPGTCVPRLSSLGCVCGVSPREHRCLCLGPLAYSVQ